MVSAVVARLRRGFDPDCEKCGGSGTVWDGAKLVRCPKCG